MAAQSAAACPFVVCPVGPVVSPFVLNSSTDLVSPIVLEDDHSANLWMDQPHDSLDVEKMHHIFNFRNTPVAEVMDDLAGTTSNGMISWGYFSRYMYHLANLQPYGKQTEVAKYLARTIFNLFVQERQEQVDSRALASGLSVSFSDSLIPEVHTNAE